MLRRAPGFTITAALTIALGIGANTTIFSILNALLLRPLAGTVRPDELVQLGRTQEGQGFDTFSYPDYLDYRAATRSLSHISTSFVMPAHLSTGGASERVRSELVSGNYFTTLGTRAAAGRLLIEEDGRAGAPAVAVLSHAAWQSRFGADRTVLGASVRLNGAPYTVVGVAEEGFNGVRLTGVVDVFVPLTTAMQLLPDAGRMGSERGAVWLSFFGRLARGTTTATAQAELGTIASALATRYPETNKGRGIRVSQGLGLDPSTRSDIGKFMTVL